MRTRLRHPASLSEHGRHIRCLLQCSTQDTQKTGHCTVPYSAVQYSGSNGSRALVCAERTAQDPAVSLMCKDGESAQSAWAHAPRQQRPERASHRPPKSGLTRRGRRRKGLANAAAKVRSERVAPCGGGRSRSAHGGGRGCGERRGRGAAGRGGWWWCGGVVVVVVVVVGAGDEVGRLVVCSRSVECAGDFARALARLQVAFARASLITPSLITHSHDSTCDAVLSCIRCTCNAPLAS